MMTTDLDRLALAVQLAAFPGTVLADDAAVLLSQGLGGICLFGSNTADGPGVLGHQLVATARAVRSDVVVAVDEEGGDVTRLHAVAGSPSLGAATLGAMAAELTVPPRVAFAPGPPHLRPFVEVSLAAAS